KDLQILLADSGSKALELMQGHKVNVIITDMRMPNMTGAEFLAKAAILQPDAYRILMTGYADLASTVSAINLGKIHRYVQKPWDNQELLTVVDEGLALYHLIRQNKQLTAKVATQNKQLKELNSSLEETVLKRTEQLKQTLLKFKHLAGERQKDEAATLEVLYNIIVSYPPLSGELARKISATCEYLAKALKLPSELVTTVTKAGLFSEIGKIALPTKVAETAYTDLYNRERRLFNEHPLHAEEILLPAQHLSEMSLIIANQLERYNGGGEPAQKAGNDIPLGSRILAVARDFWLHVEGRYDGNKMSMIDAFDAIQLHQGSYYDPTIVKALSILVASEDADIANKARRGLEVSTLKPGMKLKQNLYNLKHILLLPEGHVLTPASLEKLSKYQLKHKEQLLVEIGTTEDEKH
ncbi:MAG: HD domain-containing phosphohydrolase, partial [Shewanella sp.]